MSGGREERRGYRESFLSNITISSLIESFETGDKVLKSPAGMVISFCSRSVCKISASHYVDR